jgi:Rieske Fe-S protein
MNFVNGRLDGARMIVDKSAFAAVPFALVESPSLEFPIYVHRHGNDEYSAVLTRCMHRGCTVEPAGGRLVCPCHGSEYSAVGAILKGPTELPLIRFTVSTDASHIFIHDVAGAGR